jgi:hypothetical protein
MGKHLWMQLFHHELYMLYRAILALCEGYVGHTEGGDLQARMTVPPNRARILAVSNPIPPLDPVMMYTLLVTSISSYFSPLTPRT